MTIQTRAAVQQRHWTKDEYYRLGELGFFRGQRVELIEGELMVQSPQGPLHFNGVDVVDDLLKRLFGSGFWVRSGAGCRVLGSAIGSGSAIGFRARLPNSAAQHAP